MTLPRDEIDADFTLARPDRSFALDPIATSLCAAAVRSLLVDTQKNGTTVRA